MNKHLQSMLARVADVYDKTIGSFFYDLLAPPAEEIVLARNEVRDIAALISQLKEPYRPVCQLCLLEDRTPEEASRILGRPTKTIHTQLYRGKRLLREQLERRDSHSWESKPQ